MARSAVLLLCTLCVSVGSGALSAGITLTGDEPWIVSDTEEIALTLAVEDVAADWYKALGYPPLIVGNESDFATSVPVSSPVLVIGTPENNAAVNAYLKDDTGCFTGWESHCVKAVRGGGPGGRDVIIATGTGTRGAIFAAFSFSEEILGSVPMRAFVDLEAPYVGTIDVPPTLDLQFAPPAFKFRAMFSNDEDLNGNFHKSPLGETVFSLEIFDDYYETALRSKNNMFLVGTDPLPDERSLKLAARRGLAITSHHFDLLGTCTHRWPLGTSDWNYTKDPGTMAFAWQSSIAAQQDYEVVWSVGLRGLDDYAYPCNGEIECAMALSDAIGNMTDWVRQAQGPDAPIVTYLWDEGLNYLEKNLLKVPEGVSIVFGDEGAGFVHGTTNLTKYAGGLYYHTAMLNGHANQLSEMVPVSRIFEEIGLFIKLAKELVYSVINVSDLRPAVMTTTAALEMQYDPTRFTKSGDPNSTALEFMANWTAKYYLADAGTAKQAAAWWDAYFKVPYIVGGYGDNMLGREIHAIGDSFAKDLRAGNLSAATRNAAQTAMSLIGSSAPLWQPLLAQAQTLQQSIPASRQAFFGAHAIVQAAIHAQGVATIETMVQAVDAFSAHNNSGAVALLGSAVGAMDKMFSFQRAAEYGKWRGLYAHDRLVDMQFARRIVQDCMHAAQGLTKSPRPQRANGGYDFYNYQIPFEPNYPYMYFNKTINMNTYVRVACAGTYTGASQSQCHNTPAGANFDSASAFVEMGDSDFALRFTTDGSEPTATSSLYSQAIEVSTTTTVKAAAYLGSEQQGGVTTAVFTKR